MNPDSQRSKDREQDGPSAVQGSRSVSAWTALLNDYAAIARSRPLGALEATVLRARSRAGFDLLAHLATQGAARFVDISNVLDIAHDDELDKWAERTLDPTWAGSLAFCIGLFDDLESDRLRALRLYRSVYRTFGAGGFVPRDRIVLGQLLLHAGGLDELREYLEAVELPAGAREVIELDLCNPWSGRTPDERVWMDQFNDHCNSRDRIGIADGAGAALDRLVTDAGAEQVDGPLVSVIMPVYRPDHGLRTAVRSILDQTWANLEILLINDGDRSPTTLELLDESVSTSPKVRLVHLEANGGTYRARNAGLVHARGAFITTQDADDWSHPRRIEHQVQPMLHDARLVATRSACVRVDDDLRLIELGKRPRYRPNASSLMFRAGPTLLRIGHFDRSRKAADSEYEARIRAAFGEAAFLALKDEALAVIRRRTGSLSRSDFRAGWHHPARATYRSHYQHWHRSVVVEGRDPFVHGSNDQRPFPAPWRFDDDGTTRRFDVVFVGDWRKTGGPQFSMIHEIRALAAAGLRVGVCHLEAFRFMTLDVTTMCAPVLDVVAEGAATWVHLDEELEVGLVALRYPPILQFATDQPASWRARSMWIVVNQAPSEVDGSDLRYLPGHCDAEARRLFGCEPVWVPQGPRARDALLEGGGSEALTLADFDIGAIIDADAWFSPRRPSRASRPRVGRYSRDDPMKYPDGRTMLQVYGAPDLDVSLMGAARTVPSLLEGAPIPDNWRLLKHRAMDVRDFLDEIDFFVYFDHPRANEAFGRSILEALAAGCLVVLPWKFQPVFGDAAVYCDPEEAADVVRAFQADEQAFHDHVERARAVVRELFSPDRYVEVVSRALDGSRTGAGRR
jgi:hypothetical protein